MSTKVMADRPVKARRRTGGLRLLSWVGLALVLFIALALSEDRIEKLLASREERAQAVTVKASLGELVAAYNSTLARANNRNNAALMTELVTPDELRRIDTYMAYNLYEKERYLKNKLLDLAIKDIKLAKNGATAKVKTAEKWTYSYIDKETKRLQGDPKTVRYRVTYSLKKDEDRWLVDKVTVNSEKTKKP